MLYIASIINYLDRAAISLSMVYISKDISISVFEKGMVFSAFSLGYLPFNFLGGFLSDKISPQKLFGICILLWSILSGLTGATVSLWQLLVIRFLFGMSEGPLSSNVNKIVNNIFNNKESVTWVSIVDSATPIGTALAGILIPALAMKFSWRISFIVIMILGLIWSGLWKFVFREFDELDSEKLDKRNLLSNNKQKFNISKQQANLFIGITSCYFLYNLLLYFLISWFPVYLVKVKTLNPSDLMIIESLPWLFGSSAMLIGGIFARKLTLKNTSLNSKYLKIIRFCLICSSVSTILLGLVRVYWEIFVLITLCVVALYFTGGLYWGVINETFSAQKVGTMGGMMHGFANLATILGPLVVGTIVQTTGQYITAFSFIGLIGIILLIFSKFLLRETKD